MTWQSFCRTSYYLMSSCGFLPQNVKIKMNKNKLETRRIAVTSWCWKWCTWLAGNNSDTTTALAKWNEFNVAPCMSACVAVRRWTFENDATNWTCVRVWNRSTRLPQSGRRTLITSIWHTTAVDRMMSSLWAGTRWCLVLERIALAAVWSLTGAPLTASRNSNGYNMIHKYLTYLKANVYPA